MSKMNQQSFTRPEGSFWVKGALHKRADNAITAALVGSRILKLKAVMVAPPQESKLEREGNTPASRRQVRTFALELANDACITSIICGSARSNAVTTSGSKCLPLSL